MNPDDIPYIIHDQLLDDEHARWFAASVLGILGMADYMDADMMITRMHGVWIIKTASGTYQGPDFASTFNLLLTRQPKQESLN